MSSSLWRFDALDSLFFRESRPMGSVGGAQLSSRFPPPARTISGAVRALLGETMKVDWNKWKTKEGAEKYHPEILKLIGHADDLGAMSFSGPFPMIDGQRLYPAPLLLAVTGQAQERTYIRLQPGDSVECDLGKVYLPQFSQFAPGAKPLESDWLTEAELMKVLSGSVPQRHIEQEELFSREPRLGIAMEGSARTAAKGMLYQTEHLRLSEEVSFGVGVEGANDVVVDRAVIRLGGEGRMASVSVSQQNAELPTPTKPANARGIVLMLLTPGDFDAGWLPDGFSESTDEFGCCVWRGSLHDVQLTIKCAIVGKAIREGGWDMARHQSRPIKSLVPAGSCYFCTVDGDLDSAVEQLHGKKIGSEQELGRGEMAIGFWI